MKASNLLIPTLKEAPNEAIIDSHILMLRAGFMKKLVAGVYTYLPMGLRTLNKIENIIREEMDYSGTQEILSSAIQPKELWVESGRWAKYGPELIRFKDRHDREFCLGPTHEEIFTDLIRTSVKSYKSLPLNIYQIQSKYRDEMRPRFGLMRGREFIMKDAYSFDVDEKGLEVSYQNMYDTYSRIFTRLGLKYKVVLADTGAIGGSGSHQFMALSDVGESQIIYCDTCGYAADEEKATSKLPPVEKEDVLTPELKATPDVKACEDVAKFLNVPLYKVAKTMIYYNSETKEYAAFVVRGDTEVNIVKVVNALNSSEAFIRLATDEEIKNLGLEVGFIGPKGLKIKVFIDEEITRLNNVVIGANEKDAHIINCNYGIDFDGTVCDLKLAEANHLCPICGKPLSSERGIEVGQIFKLGTKYSLPMNCTYLDKEGKIAPMVMGCYGIGVTRTFASIIEQHHDKDGICFPIEVAPYHVVVLPINYNDELQKQVATDLYELLRKERIEVILDDRDVKPGFKFKDWDLIGVPYQIVVGKKAGEGIVEFKTRSTSIKEEVTIGEAASRIIEIVKNIK